MSPMDQMRELINLVRPIKDKVLGVVPGNHCGRTYKADGIDLMYFLCAELGITSKYDPIAALIFIRLGRQSRHHARKGESPRPVCYSIYAKHGVGNGRTAGAKANFLERQGEIINADIHVVAHTHLPLTFKGRSFEIDYHNSTYHDKETTYINTGSTLDYDGYPERMGLKPSAMVSPVAILNGTKKEVKVVL